MGYVLITGGSSGIGFELAHKFARCGHNLILVSSNSKRLKAAQNLIKSEYNISVLAVEINLADINAAQDLYQYLQKENLQIDILINNAGFGLIGHSTEIDLLKDKELMILNMITPVLLCKLILKEMYQLKKGKILNIASTAAFQPGPYNSTYFASKSFLLSYTRAIRYEAAQKGVQVSALCPGTTNTPFFRREGLKTPSYAMKASKVADAAYYGLMQNKEIIIPGAINKVLRIIPQAIKVPFIAWLKTMKEDC